MIYDFTDFQQTDEYSWQANYHGNYGVYRVRLEFDENGRRRDFSCSCPSDAYPCKHIGFLQAEIKNHIANSEEKKNKKAVENKERLTLENILENVSLDELRTFVIKKAKYNKDLTKAITLEFIGKVKQSPKKPIENIYKSLVLSDLSGISIDMEDYYDYDYQYSYSHQEPIVDLDVLKEWLKKAEDFANRQKYEEALLISQAVIEEYADWYENANGDTRDNIYKDYQSDFFDLLHKMVKNDQINKQLLYDYCKQELSKKKYFSDVCNMFTTLMSNLAKNLNPDDFISFQKDLLSKISDQSSFEAERILKHLYNFYLSNNQKENALELVEENLQIESFCKIAITQRIAEGRYAEAKHLISTGEKNLTNYHKRDWIKYKLEIAQKEKDIPVVRKIALGFIEDHFDEQYFHIYKQAFSEEEWKKEFEKLYQHYVEQEKLSFIKDYNPNIPNLLAAEKLTKQLISYIETHFSTYIMERYYMHFVEEYPEKTLEMFQKAVDSYAVANSGENHYNYVRNLLKLINELPQGNKVASAMIENYLVVYKRRPKMVGILKECRREIDKK